MPSREKWYGDGVYSKTNARGREAFYIRYGHEGRTYKERAGFKENVARGRLELRREQIKDGTWKQPKARRKQVGMTFAQFIDLFVKRYGGKRSQLRSDYVAMICGTLARQFENRPLRSITTADIDEYQTRRAAGFEAQRKFRISPSTLRKEIGALKLLFKFAVRWGHLDHNPAQEVSRPSEPPGRDRVLTDEEWARLYAELPDWMRPLCLVAISTGLRLKEICELRWADVVWERGMIRMSGDNKTGSTEPVYFGEDVQSVLEAQRGGRSVAPEDRVFGDADGEPFDETAAAVAERKGDKARARRNWLAGVFKQAAKRAGLYGRKMPRRDRVTIHTLRHTFITRLMESGVNAFVAQRLARHKSLAMTSRYTHVSDDTVRTAANNVVPFRRAANGTEGA
jgi:integrase